MIRRINRALPIYETPLGVSNGCYRNAAEFAPPSLICHAAERSRQSPCTIISISHVFGEGPSRSQAHNKILALHLHLLSGDPIRKLPARGFRNLEGLTWRTGEPRNAGSPRWATKPSHIFPPTSNIRGPTKSDGLAPGAGAGPVLWTQARRVCAQGLTDVCVTSAYPPIATVSRPSRHFVFLPLMDSFTATNSPVKQIDWARPSPT
jgi:hypothetical protein